jgi:hypothetical protein
MNDFLTIHLRSQTIVTVQREHSVGMILIQTPIVVSASDFAL